MQAIPVPLRKRIIELYEQGRSTQEIAQFSGFCVAAVRRVRQQSLAAQGTAPQTSHLGVSSAFVHKHQSGHRFGGQLLMPIGPSCRHVGSVAFGGGQSFF